MQIDKYDEARRALQEAATFDEAKDYANKSDALRIYAKQAKDPDLERWAAEIRLLAKRRIGEISQGLPASKGGANPQATLPAGGESKAEALKAAGISKGEQYRCEKLAAVPKEDFDTYLEECRASKRVASSDAMLAKLIRKPKKRDRDERQSDSNDHEDEPYDVKSDEKPEKSETNVEQSGDTPPWWYEVLRDVEKTKFKKTKGEVMRGMTEKEKLSAKFFFAKLRSWLDDRPYL